VLAQAHLIIITPIMARIGSINQKNISPTSSREQRESNKPGDNSKSFTVRSTIITLVVLLCKAPLVLVVVVVVVVQVLQGSV